MTNFSNRARWAAASMVIAFAAAACVDWKKELLEPQNPGLIDPTATGSPSASIALKVGAMGRLRRVVHGCDGNSECLWQESGMVADEFKNSDFQPDRQDIDQRNLKSTNGILDFRALTGIRGPIRDAIAAMRLFVPQNTWDIGELYMGLAFIEMSLAENYCNGIPLGSTTAGVVTLGPGLTNQQLYDSALTHVDSALGFIGSATDVASVAVRNASSIVKARILVDKGGQFGAAAALVPASAIPSTYQYVFTTSTALNSDDNGLWTLNNSVARISVADSFDIIAGQQNVIKNALPFISANDPRVPTLSGQAATPKVNAEDGITPLWIQRLFPGRDDPMPMVSGIDARLIEAEARLNATDYAGMVVILNQLRTDRPTIGNFRPSVMPANLTVPASKTAAEDLFFREKAFWTFGRGQRMSDLRRLIRQYGRTQDKVFPTGAYVKGGVYGTDVNFAVPDAELINPNFKGCIDRNA
jgi:hypothetical protein